MYILLGIIIWLVIGALNSYVFHRHTIMRKCDTTLGEFLVPTLMGPIGVFPVLIMLIVEKVENRFSKVIFKGVSK